MESFTNYVMLEIGRLKLMQKKNRKKGVTKVRRGSKMINFNVTLQMNAALCTFLPRVS